MSAIQTVRAISGFDTEDFGSEVLRVGDLNGDGQTELVFVQSAFGPRTIECITATTLAGEVLWQVGRPSAANGRVYSDLPVQVYDWDDDGLDDVLYVRQAEYLEPVEYGDDRIREWARKYGGHATLVVLDGRTGREKTTIALPAPADDSLAFADLTGRGRPEDFIVKDRYWNMWGVARTGEVLWKYTGVVGHFPAVADLDSDGRDEVFIGYALIDHDGRVLFDLKADGSKTHSDANALCRTAGGEWRLLFGNHGAHCLDIHGREVWYKKLTEAQHVFAGRFRGAAGHQVAVIDRGFPRSKEGRPADLYLLDLETGEEIWRRAMPAGCWGAHAQIIRWSGREDRVEILVRRGMGEPDAIYDGDGNVVAEFPVPPEICSVYQDPTLKEPNSGIHYCYRADVWGDAREEVILCGWKGVRIHANGRSCSSYVMRNSTIYTGV